MKYYLTCEADTHLVYSDWDGEESYDEYETYNHVFKIHKKKPDKYPEITFETNQQPKIVAVLYTESDTFSQESGKVQYLVPKNMDHAPRILDLVQRIAKLDKGFSRYSNTKPRAEELIERCVSKLEEVCANFACPSWTGYGSSLDSVEIITL